MQIFSLNTPRNVRPGPTTGAPEMRCFRSTPIACCTGSPAFNVTSLVVITSAAVSPRAAD